MVAPTITSIFPESGPAAGGTPVQIVGTDFTGTTGVTINGNAVTMYSEVDDSNVLVVAPAGTGIGDVVLTTGGGADTLTDGWTYLAYLANIVTVAEMKFFAGAGIDSAGDVDANHIILQDYAEAYLSNLLEFNLDAAGWATLSTPNKELISEWAARFAGVALIRFNMLGEAATGFTRIEAEDRINVHLYRLWQMEKIFRDASIQDFIGS